MENQSGQRLVSNILAVAGFIILIAIIVWGAFHFLNLASSGFSSLFSRTDSTTIEVVAPETAGSGQPVDVSWNYTPAGDGSYALIYQCRDGFQFRVVASTSTLNVIPCGTAYTVGNKESKGVRLVPVLTSGTSADIPLSIIYMTDGTTGTSTEDNRGAQGNTTITITRDTNTPPTNTDNNQGSTGTTGGSTTPIPTGPADLVVRILSVGVIDPISGNITQRAPISPQEVVAVTFDIKNQGGSATGAWYFTAQLPTSPAAPYSSPQQASLNPGDHIENTLRFNQVAQGGVFTVNVDPTNLVSESNENNNSASQSISGNYYK